MTNRGSISANRGSARRRLFLWTIMLLPLILACHADAAPAINLVNNTGAAIAFGGSLTINTTSEIGFNATGGGTVEVTGANNTIASTTGTALNVVSATISGVGLNFQSISADGAVNGIVLNNTGAVGGLTVTGTGTGMPANGGSIRNTTGSGILGVNTRNLSLTDMWIDNPVTTSPPPSFYSAGIELNNLAGFSNRLRRVEVSNYNTANTHGISLFNDDAHLLGFDIQGITVRDSTGGANAFLMVADGAASMKVDIRSDSQGGPSTFMNLVNSGVRVNINNGATDGIDFSLHDAIFDAVSTAGLTQPIVIAPSGGIANYAEILRNEIVNSGSVGNNTGLLNVAAGGVSAPGPETVVVIAGNTFLNSSGFRAINITPDQNSGRHYYDIRGNSIQAVARHGIYVDFREGAGAGFTNQLTIRDNEIGTDFPTAGATREALFVDVRGNAAKTVHTLIEDNTIVHTGNEFFEAVRVTAGRSGAQDNGGVTHHVTMRGNHITQNGAAVGFRAQARNSSNVSTLCLNILDNTFAGANTTIDLNQSNPGVFNLTQASTAAVQAANTGSTVATNGTINFGQPACTLP